MKKSGNYICFVSLFIINILVTVFLATVYKVGNDILLVFSIRGTAYIYGTIIGVLCALGLYTRISFAIKHPSSIGAAESKYDYCECLANDDVLTTRYFSSMILAAIESAIIALPFMGTALAYFYAGGVFCGYESVLIALITVEAMILCAYQLSLFVYSAVYSIKRN